MPADTTTDWITAVGSVFAAVGTVGAVTVALWQAQRQERSGLDVEARHVATGSEADGWEVLIQLVGVNVGRRPITIVDARLSFIVRGVLRMDVAWAENPQLPTTLQPGDTKRVAWDRDKVEQLRKDHDGAPVTHCEFIDSLGASYGSPVPGMKLTRKNWRLRREYVPS